MTFACSRCRSRYDLRASPTTANGLSRSFRVSGRLCRRHRSSPGSRQTVHRAEGGRRPSPGSEDGRIAGLEQRVQKGRGSMKVLQLGVGSVGEVTARTVAAEPTVEAVMLADVDETRCREVGEIIGARASPLSLDANDSTALERALADADLVIKSRGPATRRACPRQRRPYFWRRAGSRSAACSPRSGSATRRSS